VYIIALLSRIVSEPALRKRLPEQLQVMTPQLFSG
jgi:hypothetical protein